MRRWIPYFSLLALLAPGVTLADDVTGAERLLCAPTNAHECVDTECASGLAQLLNFQPFVIIDLEEEQIRSTATSARKRKTPFTRSERGDGLIMFQGYEMGRAFSGIISEETGEITMAIAMDHGAVVVFGNCTPAE